MSRKVHDLLIVGSGASGGIAAKVLAEQGIETLLLEAGPEIRRADFLTHSFPYDFPFRGRGSPSKIRKDGSMAAHEDTPFPGYYAELSENPYTTPPGNPFDWSYRSRILGGRTLHWGRQSLRFADFDFKPASMDGEGIDWPFSYQDLEPYYDKVEEYIGVQGFYEGLSQIPDGKFQPAFAYNCFEHLMRKAARKMDRRLTALRVAQLSRPHRGRPACHCCGSCGSGCDVDAFFSTPAVTLPDAMATGKLTLQTDSVVRHVMVDKDARATGVGYFDRVKKDYREAFAKVVVLAGSTLESARIMLNSTSPRFSTGIANSSGVVGRYLMDQTEPGRVVATLPELVGGNITQRRRQVERILYPALPQPRQAKASSRLFARLRNHGQGRSVDLSGSRRADRRVRRRLQAAHQGVASRHCARLPARRGAAQLRQPGGDR